MNALYYKYSDFLKVKYKTKVYKLPVNIPCSCPNRDGVISTGGCSFCAPQGAGFECFENTVSISDQLYLNREHIRRKYKAKQFIAYFQNYSNTYIPFKSFQAYMTEAAQNGICEIAVSTRPDTITNNHIQFLDELKKQYNIHVTIELGLQTANYHTLSKTNRGHSLAEFIDACLRIRDHSTSDHSKTEICAHVIPNLPHDNIRDVIETAKILSVLRVDHVKLHALYLMEGTQMAREYQDNRFTLITAEEYIERAITFLEYLSPQITIQRLIGRAPEEGSLFVNWNMSWRRIQNEIEQTMISASRHQGSLFRYTGGSAFRTKFESEGEK